MAWPSPSGFWQSFLFSSLLASSWTQAEVRLPSIFSEHAVLQKSSATSVWGWADPGEKVRVQFGAAEATATTGADGRWRAALDLAKAEDKPGDLIVEGKNRLVVSDVLAGEVWLTSGQSNMQLPLSATTGGNAEAARSANPRLRWFAAESGAAFLPPQEQVRGHWEIAGPETSGACSGVAYYFGRQIERDLGTPVGLILTAVGGTTIQAWMSEAAWSSHEAMRAMIKPPRKARPITTPAFYFNQLIHPLAALSFRGILWYQGEAHFSQGEFYRQAFPVLIRDWRALFGQPDLPFYFCQLPNLDKKTADPNDAGWVAELREGQDAGLTEGHTGEAVLIDVGGENLHPGNKEIVGQRLAALAEAGTYGKKVFAESPRFRKVEAPGNKLIVTFDHVGSGLVAQAGGKAEAGVQGFAIRREDGPWVWAQTEIAGDTVRVWSPEISQPTEVRYAWANNPTCNLANREGWPAAPFRARIHATPPQP